MKWFDPNNNPFKDWQGLMLLFALALALCLIFSKSAEAGEWWINIPTTSDHKDNKPYNERNWGVGLEYKVDDVLSFAGGTYHNSFREQTFYVGAVYTPHWLSLRTDNMNLKLGLFGAFASGYDKGKFVPLASPIVVVEIEQFGVDILVNPYVVALTFKFQWERSRQ